MTVAPETDLSAIPEDPREAVAARRRRVDQPVPIDRRQEGLTANPNRSVHGEPSQKPTEDERQTAVEDLETNATER